MNEVYIVGIGQIPVAKSSNRSAATMAADAIRRAQSNAGGLEPTALFVGSMLASLMAHQTQFGAVVAQEAGLGGVEAMAVDGACASGAMAARCAVSAIRSGEHDVVVACGTELMTAYPKSETTLALATASDWASEGAQGETFVSLNARLQSAYIDRYGLPNDVLAGFSVNAHHNACKNPNALFHKHIDKATYHESRFIHGAMRLFDAAPICDGAASLVLANRAVAARRFRDGYPVVRIAASTASTDTLGLDGRDTLLQLEGVSRATKRAFAQAGMSHRDVRIYEPHDAFTIMSVLSLEASGFADWGRGYELVDELGPTGALPMTTMGGLKGRGHPVGATGIYQLVEATLQLSDRAGDAQVPGGPDVALVQSLGGTGATAIVHLLERVSTMMP